MGQNNSIESCEEKDINLNEQYVISLPYHLPDNKLITKSNIVTSQFDKPIMKHSEFKNIYIIKSVSPINTNILFYNYTERYIENTHVMHNVVKHIYWIINKQIFIASHNIYDELLIEKVYPEYELLLKTKLITYFGIWVFMNNMWLPSYNTTNMINNLDMIVNEYHGFIIFQYRYAIGNNKELHTIIFNKSHSIETKEESKVKNDQSKHEILSSGLTTIEDKSKHEILSSGLTTIEDKSKHEILSSGLTTIEDKSKHEILSSGLTTIEGKSRSEHLCKRGVIGLNKNYWSVHHMFSGYRVEALYDYPIIILKNEKNNTHSYYNIELKKHYLIKKEFIDVCDGKIIEYDKKLKSIVIYNKQTVDQILNMPDAHSTDDEVIDVVGVD
jgi:hypothetical protein